MSVELPDRDGDGYLTDMSQWTPEIARAMAEADDFELTDERWEQIEKGRHVHLDARPQRTFEERDFTTAGMSWGGYAARRSGIADSWKESVCLETSSVSAVFAIFIKRDSTLRM